MIFLLQKVFLCDRIIKRGSLSEHWTKGDGEMSTRIISIYQDENIFVNHCINSRPRENQFDFHTHDICELIFLRKGDVSGIINGKTYKLQKNDLIIFRTGILHKIQLDSLTEYERINILFDENKLANKIFKHFPENIDVINCKDNKRMIEIFEKIDFYHDCFQKDNLKKILTNLVEEIIFNLSLESNKIIAEKPVLVNSIINQAVEFINDNYTSPITIEEICNKVHVSKSYLHTLFIEKLNMSPKRYINLKRLEKARSMIRKGLKPYEIYFQCGFKEYTTFYRNYKMYFGHVPSFETETEIKRNIES